MQAARRSRPPTPPRENRACWGPRGLAAYKSLFMSLRSKPLLRPRPDKAVFSLMQAAAYVCEPPAPCAERRVDGHTEPSPPINLICRFARKSRLRANSPLFHNGGPMAYPDQRLASNHSMGTEKRFLQILLLCAGILSAPVFCASNQAFAQATGGGLPDSPSQSSTRPATDDSRSPAAREVTWASLPGDFLRDQKNIWTFPVQLAKGHHWLPTLAIAGGTAGLIVADPHVMPYFRSHAVNLDRLNDTFDPSITTAEVIAIPATLMFTGYLRHDRYQVSTALLAAEAYANAAVVDLAVKAITRRKRPSDVPPGGDFTTRFLPAVSRHLRAALSPPGTPPELFRWPRSLPAAITTTAGCPG